VKKHLLLIIVSLLFTTITFAQVTPQTSKSSLPGKPEKDDAGTQFSKRQAYIKKVNKEKQAANQIKNLKNGVLLVRLRTQENAIKSLEKANNKAGADKIRSQQLQVNKLLTNAFQKNFTFCPVYFFYSWDTETVKNGTTSGVFLDSNLNLDSNLKLPEKPFFIAEITNVEPERQDPNNQNSGYNSEAAFPALVMRDSTFTQLAAPFPFFVKVRQSFPPRKRTESELVTMLDQKLQKYYKLVMIGK
jgi:hypothetical protein